MMIFFTITILTSKIFPLSMGSLSLLFSGLTCLALMSFLEMGLFSYSMFWFKLDELAIILIILSLLISLLMSLNIKLSSKKNFLGMMIWLMNFSLYLVFVSSYSVSFYIMFEMSLLPIMLMILGWGYQPERVSATYALILYTVTASFPLLLCLLTQSNLGVYTMLFWPLLPLASSPLLTWISSFFLLSFLVKFPIFTFHLWLPKAHVEAPVVGSMILAALLLKLGGYGLWRSVALLPLSKFVFMAQSLSLMGGALIAMLCISQIDMKVLIAYSSVAHMSFVIAALLSQTPLGALSAMALMIAHGVSSSAMFAGANFIYEVLHTRSLVLTFGLLNLVPILSLMWFIASLGNMGAPPTINLMSEIWALTTTASLSFWNWLPISVSSFFAAAYTLILYSSTQQGQTAGMVQMSKNLSLSSILVMLIHNIWLIEGFLLFI